MSSTYLSVPPELAHTLAVVVDSGSLEAAAAQLALTQPAVSLRIRTLEKLTGQVLLVRSRPVKPTPAGEAVVAHGRLVANMDRLLAKQLNITNSARFALAVNADSLATWLLRPFALLGTNLDVTFDIHRDDEDFTHHLLSEGTVLAAVTTQSSAIAGCSATPLGRMRYVPSATTDFVQRYFPAGLTSLALGQAPLVNFDDRDDLQHKWLRERGAREVHPPSHRVPASSEFATAVSLGMGWGMLPLAQRAQHPHLVSLDASWIDVPLYWQRWKMKSIVLDAVTEAVVAAARGSLI